EDVRIGEAEAVDALLDIADQETVGLWAFATEGLENGVLGVVDVLVFVDENETEFLAPLPRNVGHSKHAKGVLFEVVEIHHAQFTFGVSEAGGELPGEAEQDEHLRTDPTPVLCQRIAGTIRADERMEKGRLIEEIVERLAPDSLLAAGPFLIGGESEVRGGGALGAGGLGGKLGKGGGAFGGLGVISGERLERREPAVPPVAHAGNEPFGPLNGLRRFKHRRLGGEPGLRVAKRLAVMVQLENQRADRKVPAASLGLNEELDGFGVGTVGGVVIAEDFLECFIGQQAFLLLGKNGELGIELELVKMLADQLETEAVKRSDMGGVEEGELLGELFFHPSGGGLGA